MFKQLQVLILVLGVVAVLLAVVQAQVYGVSEPTEEEVNEQTASALASASAAVRALAEEAAAAGVQPPDSASALAAVRALAAADSASVDAQTDSALAAVRAMTAADTTTTLDAQTALALTAVRTLGFVKREGVPPASRTATLFNYYLFYVLRWGIIIAPILISILIAITNQFKSGNKWIMLRAGAESLKREIYRYRARAGIYSDEAAQDTTPEEKLADKLTQIRRQVMKTAVSEASLTPYTGPLPPKMYGAAAEDDGLSILSSEDYRKIRLGDQLSYYSGKTGSLEKRLQRLRWWIIVGGGAGGAREPPCPRPGPRAQGNG